CILHKGAEKMRAVLPEIVRLWVDTLFYPCATGIEELGGEPFHDDFLVVGGIWTIEGRICRRRLLALSKQIAEQKQYRAAKRKPFHPAAIFHRLKLLVQPNPTTSCAGRSWQNLTISGVTCGG